MSSTPEVAANIFEQIVNSVKKLTTFLTWGRLLLLTTLAIIGIAAVTVWENRQPIYTQLTAGDKYATYDTIPKLSSITADIIKNAVDRRVNLVAVQVVRMDFRNNTRDTSHFYSKLKSMQTEFEVYMSERVILQPLFATADVEQNERLIKIMEQEFVCVNTPQNAIDMIPSAATGVSQICSISVPPRYGKMVGYVNIWLAKPMTTGQLADYKSIAREISDEIYDRDVIKSKK